MTVNLSDLAAKGAEPIAALMGFTIGRDSEWDEKFIEGVAAACEAYSLALVGGDTIALPADAPRVFGLTAVGRGGGPVPSRSGGKPGDALWVVGFLGDAAAGLALVERRRRGGRAAGRGLSPARCRSLPPDGCSRPMQRR